MENHSNASNGSRHSQGSCIHPNVANIQGNAGYPDSQCGNCHNTSALIARLWQRIAGLEKQLLQVSAEKSGIENAFRLLLQWQTSSVDPYTKASIPGVYNSGQSYLGANTGQSFDSSDTLVETTPAAEKSILTDMNIMDQPLIEFSVLDNVISVYSPRSRHCVND